MFVLMIFFFLHLKCWELIGGILYFLKQMIRGVKVRQQGGKPETKKAGKSQKNQHGTNAATTAGTVANNGTPSSLKPKTDNKTSKII